MPKTNPNNEWEELFAGRLLEAGLTKESVMNIMLDIRLHDISKNTSLITQLEEEVEGMKKNTTKGLEDMDTDRVSREAWKSRRGYNLAVQDVLSLLQNKKGNHGK